MDLYYTVSSLHGIHTRKLLIAGWDALLLSPSPGKCLEHGLRPIPDISLYFLCISVCLYMMVGLAGSADMTLSWHCRFFPGDIPAEAWRRWDLCPRWFAEDTDGFHSVVLWPRGREYPIALYVQYFSPLTPTNIHDPPPLSLHSLSLPGTQQHEMCQRVSKCRQGRVTKMNVMFACEKKRKRKGKKRIMWPRDSKSPSSVLPVKLFWVNLYMQIWFPH